MEIKAIITGSTGMVGEGVLHECLQHPDVKEVLVINRRPGGVKHPKLKEIIHNNFHDMLPVAAQLHDYNACYFCLGVSSVGMKEPEYYNLTYNLTLHAAQTLSKFNPDMTFCYVSGASTDSTEKGKSMWARVKGKTENDLMKLPFKQVFAFRPGLMKAAKGAKNVPAIYKSLSWLYPVLHWLFPSKSCDLAEVGQAMINVTLFGYGRKILEVRDIVTAAKR